MSDDTPRPLSSAPSARAARAQGDQALEDDARAVADALTARGAAVVAVASDADRDHARTVARRAGDIIGRTVRTQAVGDDTVHVWDTERTAEERHQDAHNANITISEAMRKRGPLTGQHRPPETGPDADDSSPPPTAQ